VAVKKQKIALMLTGAVLVATAASAQGRYYDERRNADYGGPYVGLNISQIDYKEDGLRAITPTGGYFRIGQQFSPNLAIEGRIGGGFSDDSTNGYAVRVDALYAGYIKGRCR
jgi:hypothetical protein